jgi:hypothetical protein
VTPEEARAGDLAALLMIGAPQAGIAQGIWAWSLAQSIAPDYSHSGEDLAWVIRLNPFDWMETFDAISELISYVSDRSSTPYRDAAASVLRIFGSVDADKAAGNFAPAASAGESWRRVTPSFSDLV